MDQRKKDPWEPAYNTGIAVIDEQHHELFRKIDALTLALYEGKGMDELRALMSHLQKYILEHFETEEELMRRHHYPEYHEHVKQHRVFEGLFETMRSEFESRGGGVYVAIRIEREVRRWWEQHILGRDRGYIPYIPADGQPPRDDHSTE